MTQPSKTMKLTKDEVDRLIQSYQTNQDEQAQSRLSNVIQIWSICWRKNIPKGKVFMRISDKLE